MPDRDRRARSASVPRAGDRPACAAWMHAPPTETTPSSWVPVRATRRRSPCSSSAIAARCASTAIGWSARSTTPRTWCRRRSSGRGGARAASRAGPRCGLAVPHRDQRLPRRPRPAGPAGAAPGPRAGDHRRAAGPVETVARTDLPWLQPLPDRLREPAADQLTNPRPSPSPARRSSWRSSPPSSTCRPAAGRSSSCATCSAGRPARPPSTWASPTRP